MSTTFPVCKLCATSMAVLRIEAQTGHWLCPQCHNTAHWIKVGADRELAAASKRFWQWYVAIEFQLTASGTQQQIRGPSPPTDNT